MENPIILDRAQCVYKKVIVGCVEGILNTSSESVNEWKFQSVNYKRITGLLSVLINRCQKLCLTPLIITYFSPANNEYDETLKIFFQLFIKT